MAVTCWWPICNKIASIKPKCIRWSYGIWNIWNLSVMFCVLHIVLYCFQNNSVYDSTQFDNGATPVNPLYAASLQSPDSITGYSIDSAQSLEVGAIGQGYQQNYTVQQHWNICMAFKFWSFFFLNTCTNWKGMMPDLHNALATDTVFFFFDSSNKTYLICCYSK